MTRYHLIPWAMAIILVTVLFTMDGTCQARDRVPGVSHVTGFRA